MSDASQRTRTIAWSDPTPAVRAAPSMRGIDYIRAIANGELPAPPISDLMGMRIIEVEEGRVVFGAQPAEYHYNPLGTVHGGLAATLFDSAMACAIHTLLPAGMAYTTIELHVTYLRPITIDTGWIRCDAHALHAGRRIATAEAKLFDAEDKLYGHATTTCVMLTPLAE